MKGETTHLMPAAVYRDGSTFIDEHGLWPKEFSVPEFPPDHWQGIMHNDYVWLRADILEQLISSAVRHQLTKAEISCHGKTWSVVIQAIESEKQLRTYLQYIPPEFVDGTIVINPDAH